MNNFLSAIAVLLSAISLAFSGFTTYQLFEQQKKFSSIDSTLSELQKRSSDREKQISELQQQSNPVPSQVPQSSEVNSPVSSSNIQPGQFVQLAFKDKGKVELLSLNRIQDPDTKSRDVVNVQMRIRLLRKEPNESDSIAIDDTKARNPETSEVYESVDYDRSSGRVWLRRIEPGSSADCYVWLRIPEGVRSIDLFVPETAAFKNVPVPN
jgi:hypothetical protein